MSSITTLEVGTAFDSKKTAVIFLNSSLCSERCHGSLFS